MENKNLLAALVKAQLEIRAPIKEGVNPMFKSKYATLDAVYAASRTPLANHGLLMCSTIDCDDHGRYFAVVTLYHVSGESIQSKFPMKIEKDTNQGIASARTYAIRYATCNLLSLPGDDDDDGNASSLTDAQQREIEFLIDGDDELLERVLNGYKVKELKQIKSINYNPIVNNLRKRKQVAVSA